MLTRIIAIAKMPKDT